jgi:hypothetical protein
MKNLLPRDSKKSRATAFIPLVIRTTIADTFLRRGSRRVARAPGPCKDR